MAQLKLGSTGFVYIDIDEAPISYGVMRSAKKILADGAIALSRHTTYAFAALGIKACGASSGVSFGTADRSEATQKAASDWASMGRSDVILMMPDGTAVSDDSKSIPLSQYQQTNLHVASTLAVASGWAGELKGRSVRVTGSSSTASSLAARLADLGAKVVSGEPAVELAFLGAGNGELDHLNAADLRAEIAVGFAPNSVTARGLAQAKRNGSVVLADFLATSGPLIALAEPVADANTDESKMSAHVTQIERLIGEHIDAIDRASVAGPFLESCFAAERFMATWVETLPFGRPLA